MAGPFVEFLAPESFPESEMVQLWIRGGNIPLREAAETFMAARFPDPRVFRVKVGGNGISAFGHLWANSDASDLYGTVAWVGNGLLCCAQVDPGWFDDEGPLAMMSFFVFHYEKRDW